MTNLLSTMKLEEKIAANEIIHAVPRLLYVIHERSRISARRLAVERMPSVGYARLILHGLGRFLSVNPPRRRQSSVIP